MSMILNVMDAAYERFLVAPDKTSYLELRSLLLGTPELVRRWSDLRDLELPVSRFDAYEEGIDFAAYWNRADDLAYAWRLCSRYHYLLAVAADYEGDVERCEVERFQLSTCLEGVLSTGDGSRQAPFQVLHTTDIQDVMRTLKRRIMAQHMAQAEDRLIDLVTCIDGSEWYFDRGDLQFAQADMPLSAAAANRVSNLYL